MVCALHVRTTGAGAGAAAGAAAAVVCDAAGITGILDEPLCYKSRSYHELIPYVQIKVVAAINRWRGCHQVN